MCDALSRVLVLPEEQESNEELYDICRAYGLLLNATGAVQFQDYQTCSKEVNMYSQNREHFFRSGCQLHEHSHDQIQWNLLKLRTPLY